MSANKTARNITLEVKWALLCKGISIDQQTNQVSLFSIVEDLTINKSQGAPSPASKPSSFPAKTPINFESTLVVQLERGEGSHVIGFDPEMKLEIEDPVGEVMFERVFPITFEEGKYRLRTIVGFNAVTVKDPGIYDYIVSVRASKNDSFREEAIVPLEIKILE